MRLSLSYLLIGGAWVAFSDRVLASLGLPLPIEQFIGTIKGTLFVLVTAAFLYAFSRAGLTRVRNAQVALAAEESRIRQAYVDVLDAVTGGKLVLVTSEELQGALGTPITRRLEIHSNEEISGARKVVREAALAVLPPERVSDALSASSEAFDNALKHGGDASFETLRRNGSLQVEVSDHGPGIDFRLLPRATLLPGFSTAQTLGMGFTIMLQLSERLLICTTPGSTSILLEFSDAGDDTQ